MEGWPDHACVGCSFVADQVADVAHLNARDSTLAFVSRALQGDIERLKARMGWKMRWYTITDRFDVRSKGTSRIQLDFNYHGTRYRPTIAAKPSVSNLYRARAKLKLIKARIASGTFSFAEELPSYRYKQRLARTFSAQWCNDVFDSYLMPCEARMAKLDLACSTVASYCRVINAIWRPAIGARRFDQATYSMLVKIADAKKVGKKAYNSIVSIQAAPSSTATAIIRSATIPRAA